MIYKKIVTCTYVFWRFFHGSGLGKKRPIRIRTKGPGSETLLITKQIDISDPEPALSFALENL